MAFCKLSNDFLMDGYTYIENAFINEYLLKADGEAIKAYIYGLYLSKNATEDNDIDSVCRALNTTRDCLFNIFLYWQNEGLVQILSTDPFEIKYLPFKNKLPKKYKAGRFDDFNTGIQELFTKRMITPNEYNEYYETMDNYKITPEAMIMIAKYSIDLKGENVNYRYILTIATNWANEGVKTVKDVEKKLSEYSMLSDSINLVTEALGKKGVVGLDEKQLFTKWTNTWGYSIDSIVATAKLLKKHDFNSLDKKLEEFYRLNIFTVEEITNHIETKNHLYQVAVAVNKKLGIFYEDLDNIIETYTSPWLSKGYTQETLEIIANYCFLCNIKTLSGLDRIIHSFYKIGLISTSSVQEYIANFVMNDNKIQSIIESSGSTRSVTNMDRTFYRTWKNDWAISDEIIDYATTLANGKASPMTYLNQILSNWHKQGIKTVDEAKKASFTEQKNNNPQAIHQYNYTPQELSALFSDINDFDNLDL